MIQKMEAKDTQLPCPNQECIREERSNCHSCGWWEGRQAGIKEVVEWIERNSHSEARYTDDLHITRSWLELSSRLWQAQLKKWGVKDG